MELEFDKELTLCCEKRRLVPDRPRWRASGRGRAGGICRKCIARQGAENVRPASGPIVRCREDASVSIAVAPEAASRAAIAAPAPVLGAATLPWYRRLFATPNLSYTMGTLVVLFSGFLGYLVWQNQLAMREAEVARIADGRPAATAPVAADRQELVTNTATANAGCKANALYTPKMLRSRELPGNADAAKTRTTTRTCS